MLYGPYPWLKTNISIVNWIQKLYISKDLKQRIETILRHDIPLCIAGSAQADVETERRFGNTDTDFGFFGDFFGRDQRFWFCSEIGSRNWSRGSRNWSRDPGPFFNRGPGLGGVILSTVCWLFVWLRWLFDEVSMLKSIKPLSEDWQSSVSTAQWRVFDKFFRF